MISNLTNGTPTTYGDASHPVKQISLDLKDGNVFMTSDPSKKTALAQVVQFAGGPVLGRSIYTQDPKWERTVASGSARLVTGPARFWPGPARPWPPGTGYVLQEGAAGGLVRGEPAGHRAWPAQRSAR